MCEIPFDSFNQSGGPQFECEVTLLTNILFFFSFIVIVITKAD